MNTTEVFLVAMLIIFSVPYLIWRLFRTDYFAPLVVVQTVAGIVLGPGILGAAFPEFHGTVFSAPVIQSLNGVAWWGVMLFVWIAGIELDLQQAWAHRRESGITASLALVVPLVLGCGVAAVMLMFPGWLGSNAAPWQFVVGVGMACAVTALPVLILLMEKLDVLRQPVGQRILRYSSVDDIRSEPCRRLMRLSGWQTGWSGRLRRFRCFSQISNHPQHDAVRRLIMLALSVWGDGAACTSSWAPSSRGPSSIRAGSISKASTRCATTCCWWWRRCTS